MYTCEAFVYIVLYLIKNMSADSLIQSIPQQLLCAGRPNKYIEMNTFTRNVRIFIKHSWLNAQGFTEIK